MKWLKRLFKKKKVEVAPTEQLNIPAVSNSLLESQIKFYTNMLKWKYGIKDNEK